MKLSLRTIREKCQKVFNLSSSEEDLLVEKLRSQAEKQDEIDSVSNAYSHWLCQLFRTLEKQTHHQIKFEDLETFGIRYEKFELDTGVGGPCQPLDKNTFFSPNFAKVENLQPDPDQWRFEELMYFLDEWPEPRKSIFQDQWPECYESLPYNEVKSDDAESLCAALYVAFASLYWKECGKKDSICLQDQTNWKRVDHGEAFDVDDGWLVSGFWLDHNCRSGPQKIWHARDKPHIMATIAHGYPKDDESLLLGDILAIIALMVVRLVNNSVPEHNIVPVLLYSYTGDKHGRVLQGHMSHEHFVIRASKFYDFSAKQDAHLKLLLQHMVGDLVGSTMTLEHPQLKSTGTSMDSDPNFGSL